MVPLAIRKWTGTFERWSDEIKRRVADIDAGNVEPIPWQDVRRRLLDRLNAR
jgi:putative addiction module component (TIGR02574 family)